MSGLKIQDRGCLYLLNDLVILHVRRCTLAWEELWPVRLQRMSLWVRQSKEYSYGRQIGVSIK